MQIYFATGRQNHLIITPSHFTRRNLKYFNIDPKKIVIHNGLDPHFYPRNINEQKIAQKPIIFQNLIYFMLVISKGIKTSNDYSRVLQSVETKIDLPKLLSLVNQ